MMLSAEKDGAPVGMQCLTPTSWSSGGRFVQASLAYGAWTRWLSNSRGARRSRDDTFQTLEYSPWVRWDA